MPKDSTPKRRRKRALDYGHTTDTGAFKKIAKQDNRINIVAEGDSWFAYPPKWVVEGPPANAIDHLCEDWAHTGKTNLLCTALNGDTAKRMLENKRKNKQFRKLKKLCKKVGDNLHLILISAGGNDIVGKNKDDTSYLDPVIKPYTKQKNAADFIDNELFNAKVDEVIGYYENLLQIRHEYARNAHIVCHSYDFLQPSDEAAAFIGGVVTRGPWVHPVMTAKRVPKKYQAAIVKELLSRFDARLRELAGTDKHFHVAKTQGLLIPGGKRHWVDEMHPTPKGFRLIANALQAEIGGIYSQLKPA